MPPATKKHFDVRLKIEVPAGALDLQALVEALASSATVYRVESFEGTLLTIAAADVPAQGSAAMLDALRATQAGLSAILRQYFPEFAERGGLFWTDVLSASAVAAD